MTANNLSDPLTAASPSPMAAALDQRPVLGSPTGPAAYGA